MCIVNVYRVFANNSIVIGESLNWRADWKMFSGISYASMVKLKSRDHFVNTKIKLPDKDKQTTPLKWVRTKYEPIKDKAKVVNFAPLTKCSDMTSKPRKNNTRVSKSGIVIPPNVSSGIHVHNRFNILSNTEACDSFTNHHIEKTDTVDNCVNDYKHVNIINTASAAKKW